MTLEELREKITNPKDGTDYRLRDCWNRNNAKSIFYITGLDVSHLLKGPEISPFTKTKQWTKS